MVSWGEMFRGLISAAYSALRHPGYDVDVHQGVPARAVHVVPGVRGHVGNLPHGDLRPGEPLALKHPPPFQKNDDLLVLPRGMKPDTTTRLQPVILVGVGNLGSALLRYSGFNKEGFEIVAAFDADPGHVRDTGTKTPILAASTLPGFVKDFSVKLAILAVPAPVAQQVVNELVATGIHAILNFAPVVLEVPDQVVVNNVDLAVELANLSYFIR